LHSLSIPMMRPLEELNAQIFRDQLNAKFKLCADGSGPMLLELIEAEEKSGAAMELFSLRFAGPFMPRLQQQTHRLEQEKIGEFEIFLTPISADQQQGTVYEAVFHRFRKKPA
jgi:Domain of unknown function (DUF6916)